MIQPSPSPIDHAAVRILAQVLSTLLLLLIFVPALLSLALFAEGPNTEEKTFIVERGLSAVTIGRQLEKQNLVLNASLFRVASRLVGSLKAGEYALPPKASAFAIAKILNEGHSVVRTFTAVEGLTSADIVALLNQAPALTGSVDSIPDEGSLLPETYRYTYGDTRESVLARMQTALQEKLDALWSEREQALPLKSSHDAIVLASIIEKETGKAEERPRIAGVFYNRLERPMRLQSDPTVIYALTKGLKPLDRALTRKDLTVHSPFNTYVHDGLPPEPICNPGAASLNAALHPEHHTFLYFVADGNGGHTFSSSLAEHNKNVTTWLKALRQKGKAP
ncbi:MAG: endolytic transglycosylase MltG [Alphaproteobacteria bacterium]|nr:endolytic transglycosylase MltG [Alphaproteobacteria bacterium]